MTLYEMVEKFQCPGCACGMNRNCGEFKYDERELKCMGHVLGTSIGLGNRIALGLPRGFNKPGFDGNKTRNKTRNKIDIRLWPKGESPIWDNLNIPVWAMVLDGFLFVRTYLPRLNLGYVDVIESGTMDMVPSAFDVSKILDDID